MTRVQYPLASRLNTKNKTYTAFCSADGVRGKIYIFIYPIKFEYSQSVYELGMQRID